MQRMRTPAAERKHSQERLPKGCSYPNLKHRQRGPDLHYYENDRVFVGQINNLPVTRRIPPRKRRLRQNHSGITQNRLPTREVQMLKKPTLCIFFITRYISHSIRHPVPLILFDRSAAGDWLGQFHSISKSLRRRSGNFWRWLCCTSRSRAWSRPSTRAHASARCSLLAHSRSPRGPKTASAVRSA